MAALFQTGADAEPIPPDWDVILVGARCGGAATALCLARRGLRVLVLERGRYGSDTLSTHALMRPAVHQLHRWGVLDRLWRSGVPAVRATTFHYDGAVTSVPIKGAAACPRCSRLVGRCSTRPWSTRLGRPERASSMVSSCRSC
jgi:choline dehydrogenase-like flavoprotein